MEILVKNGIIVTHDEDNTVLKNGAVYIANDRIDSLGPSSEMEKEHSGVERVVDAGGRVVIPGMICGHMHFYSAFARGMSLKETPRGFLEILDKLWWKLDKTLLAEDVYYSALLGFIDSIKSGVTTVVDHHASPSFITGSLDAIEKASRELGVRSSLCYEVTNRNGEDGAKKGLAENARFLEKSLKSDDLVTGLTGLHASFTLGDNELEEAARIIKKYSSGIHIHVCEDQADQQDSIKKYGLTVIERLNRHGLLDQKSILAHCIHISEKDYPILARSGSNIIHNPRSNMNNAVGTLDITKLKEYGLQFGLGTDGMSADMKDELIVANLIHKHVHQDNNIGTQDVFDALFKVNPAIVKKITGVETGVMKAGNKADIVITGYIPPTLLTSSNVLGHVMFGLVNSPVRTTIINGRVCMDNGVIPGIDERAIAEKSRELASDAWDRLYS